MIDLHCHIDLYDDPPRVVAACQKRGLYVLSVTTTPSAWAETAALAPSHGRIRTAIGLHPHLAHQREYELALFDELLPQTRYVGEVGLDGAPEFKPHWDAQIRVFEHVLAACSDVGGRILSIHSRHASSAVLDLLEAHPEAGLPVLHWFSGSQSDLERASGLGCYFSVGPSMLRGNRGRALAAAMPRTRVITESDGPFAQRDGRPLMPWHVDQALASLADIWSVSTDDAHQLTLRNLRALATGVPPDATRA